MSGAARDEKMGQDLGQQHSLGVPQAQGCPELKARSLCSSLFLEFRKYCGQRWRLSEGSPNAVSYPELTLMRYGSSLSPAG